MPDATHAFAGTPQLFLATTQGFRLHHARVREYEYALLFNLCALGTNDRVSALITSNCSLLSYSMSIGLHIIMENYIS